MNCKVFSDLLLIAQRSLERWNIIAQHPQDFLIDQFHLDPSLVLAKLQQQANERNRDLATLLAIHDKAVPQFTALVPTEIARTEDCG
jgi:hypothetical protein